jgi:hypothetical protein
MATMQIATPRLRAAGVSLLNPEIFTEVDFEPTQQTNEVVRV